MTQRDSVKRAVAAHTERLLAAGGSVLRVKLSPEATAKLAEMCQREGVSRTQMVERLICG